ncbi:inhibitor of sigma-G Gin protein [Scopulibacillus darangshiensis]|uniref:Inhibitor of sigma-G Gin protein n=1 Tax=Scopulibacillus darangshiensis TaxID=442528 RepID=A0A4R2NM56_9BACL|nr:sigma factor G inhibitor Gin [Scopulibacillus darangshiensis]TCP22572.1 inhibitor of sigma-G Gin protein [Scopulibacillus darangshiensis]
MAVTAKKYTGETCMICNEKKAEGIHICDQLICDSCQKEMLETDVNDIKYHYYLKKLSKLSIQVKHAMESGHSS